MLYNIGGAGQVIVPVPRVWLTGYEIATPSLTAISTASKTIVVKIPPDKFTAGSLAGSLFRVRFMTFNLEGATPLTSVISSAYISEAAASGDAWDSLTTPTQLFWSGSGSLTALNNGGKYVSDQVSFSPSGSKAIILSVNCGAEFFMARQAGQTGVSTYVKNAVQEADDANRGASYSLTSSTMSCFDLIEVTSG